MKSATMTFLSSCVLAALSAGLAYQTAMVFIYGGGNIPSAFGFIVSASVFGFSMLMLVRSGRLTTVKKSEK